MSQRKTFLYLAVLTALSLIVCVGTFVSLAARDGAYVVTAFAVNFPLCLLLCVAYYHTARRLSRLPLLRRNSVCRVTVGWLCATVVGVALNAVVRCAMGVGSSVAGGIMTFLLWNSVMVLGVELYIYHRSALDKEKQLARLEKEKAAYQFEALKQQINPHFLFNSLNALASLAYQDAEKTNLFAKKLSSVYRYLLLTADKQTVALSEELSFLNSYLYLEHIRFGSAMQVRTNIPDPLLSMRIVPASLQLLVENALKHNAATEANPLVICISADENELVVTNNLQPRGEVATNKKGLQNLRRQYEACGKTVSIDRSPTAFTVRLQLI